MSNLWVISLRVVTLNHPKTNKPEPQQGQERPEINNMLSQHIFTAVHVIVFL